MEPREQATAKQSVKGGNSIIAAASIGSGPWGERAAVLQPKVQCMKRGLSLRATFKLFHVAPEDEGSSFREGESSRQSITLSLPKHRPGKVGWRADDRKMEGLWGIFCDVLIGVSLPGWGHTGPLRCQGPQVSSAGPGVEIENPVAAVPGRVTG